MSSSWNEVPLTRFSPWLFLSLKTVQVKLVDGGAIDLAHGLYVQPLTLGLGLQTCAQATETHVFMPLIRQKCKSDGTLDDKAEQYGVTR